MKTFFELITMCGVCVHAALVLDLLVIYYFVIRMNGWRTRLTSITALHFYPNS